MTPLAADRIRKLLGYGLALGITLLLFRVLGRTAGSAIGAVPEPPVQRRVILVRKGAVRLGVPASRQRLGHRTIGIQTEDAVLEVGFQELGVVVSQCRPLQMDDEVNGDEAVGELRRPDFVGVDCKRIGETMTRVEQDLVGCPVIGMLLMLGILVALPRFAALALTACGSDSLSEGDASATPEASTSAPTVDEALVAKLPESIKSAGVIKIGTDATYQPNEFLDADGKTVIGMDVDLFDAVMAKFGVKTEWVPSAFDAIILGVQSGKYDVGVSSFTVNNERMAQATMVSYFKAGTQWVTQKGNPKAINPDDACGKTVAVQKGTVQADVDLPARQKACTDAGKPEINVLVDADQAKVTASVQSGKADAMLVDLPPAIAAVDLTGGTVELLGTQYDSAPYGYAVPKDQTEFANAIVDALKALEKDGTYKAINDKYFKINIFTME